MEQRMAPDLLIRANPFAPSISTRHLVFFEKFKISLSAHCFYLTVLTGDFCALREETKRVTRNEPEEYRCWCCLCRLFLSQLSLSLSLSLVVSCLRLCLCFCRLCLRLCLCWLRLLFLLVLFLLFLFLGCSSCRSSPDFVATCVVSSFGSVWRRRRREFGTERTTPQQLQ